MKKAEDKDNQNKTLGVFDLPTTKKRCKVEALTDAMKKARIYMKLRQARRDRRHHGKREKKAKEAEANKK